MSDTPQEQRRQPEMRVTIRAAQPADAKAIAQLMREELDLPISAADTAQVLARLCVSPRNRVFVATVAEAVIGFVHVCDYDAIMLVKPMKVVMALAVSKQYRRVGIGANLLLRAERWALETGAAGLRTEVGEIRTEAHSFYRHCGYFGDQREVRFQKLLDA